jgi:hypothetical protein
MPQHSASRSTIAPSFANEEWDLLVGLPGRVLIAATSADPDGTGGVEAGLAGIEAIASGRARSSRLVQDVVGAIYSERTSDRLPGADDPAGVLADCRAAARTLDRRASDADAAAYREWLLHIAAAAGRVPAVRRFQVDLLLALTT